MKDVPHARARKSKQESAEIRQRAAELRRTGYALAAEIDCEVDRQVVESRNSKRARKSEDDLDGWGIRVKRAAKTFRVAAFAVTEAAVVFLTCYAFVKQRAIATFGNLGPETSQLGNTIAIPKTGFPEHPWEVGSILMDYPSKWEINNGWYHFPQHAFTNHFEGDVIPQGPSGLK